VFSSDQEVEKKTKLSQKVFQKTIRKTQQGGKPEPVLSIETKTPWGVVLKPVIRGRFAASEQQVEKTNIFAFEKTEIKSFKPLNVAFKKVPIQESKAVEKQPESIETAVPTICIESEVRTQCNSTTTQTWLNSDSEKCHSFRLKQKCVPIQKISFGFLKNVTFKGHYALNS
jgi:hypothetical protein